MDSRRNTYCPPARGYIAASSPYVSAPRIVTTPETTHAISNQNGELTLREMSAETMNMPEPIIDPATSIVASVSVSALTNSRDEGAVDSAVAVVDVKAVLSPRYSGSVPPRSRAKGTPVQGVFPVDKRLRTTATERGVGCEFLAAGCGSILARLFDVTRGNSVKTPRTNCYNVAE
jgi:hypothetical protein